MMMNTIFSHYDYGMIERQKRIPEATPQDNPAPPSPSGGRIKRAVMLLHIFFQSLNEQGVSATLHRVRDWVKRHLPPRK